MTGRQCLIPCDEIDRNLFKVMACERGKTMKKYFHEVVIELVKRRKK